MNNQDTSARVWVPQPDDYNVLAERIASAHRKHNARIIIYKNNQPFDMLGIEEFNEVDYFSEMLELMGEHHLDFADHRTHNDDTRVQAARMVC